MGESSQAARYRFGVFEADAATGELRRAGLRVKVNVQPFQLLLLLLARPGEILTREELARELWPDGTFVDYEHGVNSAVNRVREALGDSARNPRFVETLARRGYRFVAPVERLGEEARPAEVRVEPPKAEAPLSRFLASPEELPRVSVRTAQGLFLALQGMYLGFYVGALGNLAEIEQLFAPLDFARSAVLVLTATAGLLIPVRVFLATAVLFRAPGLRARYLRLWPYLLPCDVLWALSPFLLLHHINVGVALACMAPLVYAPFAQRSLMLMGADGRDAGIGAGM